MTTRPERKQQLREYSPTYRNTLRVLQIGGATPKEAKPVADRIGRFGPTMGAFDHGEIWGLDGKPTRIVGNPYNLDHDDLDLIEAIRGLGLSVRISGHSDYHRSALLVIVEASAARALSRIAG